MKEKISVIVTVYNRFEYVRNVILSLINQTLQIDELILADDGSKENIKEYIEDLIPQCQFAIKHVWQEDIGFRLARSRNNGANVAEGEFLIFLDQDVIFSKTFIDEVYKVRKRKRIVFVRGYQTSEFEKDQVLSHIKEQEFDYEKVYKIICKENVEKEFNKIIFKDKLYRMLYWFKLRSRGAKMVGMMFALYKKDYEAINGFDDNYKGWGQEDDDFGNRFYKYGGEVYPLALKNYLFHMYHYFDPTKKDSPNIGYYRQRKKEINKRNYKAKNGISNSVDTDKIKIEILN